MIRSGLSDRVFWGRGEGWHAAALLRVALAVLLAVLSIGKLVSPYVRTYAIPEWTYYGSAVLEMLLSALLMTPLYRRAAVGSIVFFGAASLLSIMHDGDCG